MGKTIIKIMMMKMSDTTVKMKYLCKKCDECKHYKYKGTYNKKDFSFLYCNGNKDLVEKYDWRPHVKGKNTYIRLTSKYNTKVEGTDKLHGMLAEKGLVVDHINRNGRDNRLCNLRLVLPLMNQMNKGTEYHNVVKRANGRYVGHVTVNGKTYYTKQCKTPKEAMYEVERLQKTQMKISRRTVIKL